MDAQIAIPVHSSEEADGGNLDSFSLLVVDDDASNRDALSRRLKRRGYRAAVAVDGPDALRRIAHEPFDLVLLDVMMPGMSGLEVLRRIRQNHQPTELPVIMATARDQSADVVNALELGANDYVTKPLDFPVVAARVQTQLFLKRAVRQILDLEQRLSQRNAELEEANRQLLKSARRTKHELQAAAKVQEALLPTAPPEIDGLQCAWALRPCQELAGDSLNVIRLDADHVAFYVLDVSGHGVAASLQAVAATRLLSMSGDPDSLVTRPNPDGGPPLPEEPARVAERLNRKLPWDPNTEQFLTLFYAVLNVRTRELRYVSAGHPPAVRVPRTGTPSTLASSGLPIGVGEIYEQQSIRLDEQDRVYLYSDGVSEAMGASDQLFGADNLVNTLSDSRSVTLHQSVALLLQALDRWFAGQWARDDISVVAFEVG